MLRKKIVSFDDIIALAIVILLIMMTRTHQAVYFYSAMGCCLLRISKPIVLLPGYMMSSLSTSYFAVSEGTGAGRYMSMLLILSFIISSVYHKENVIKYDYLGIISVLIFGCFVSALIGPVQDYNTPIQMAMNLIIFLFIQGMKDVDLNRLTAHLVITFALLAVSVFVEAMTNSVFLLEQRYTGVSNDNEDGVNANRMAIMLEQCGAICIACFMYYKNYIVKVLLIACVSACVFVIIATGSRTGLIALLVAIAFSAIVIGGIKKTKIIIPLLSLLIIGHFMVDYLASTNSSVLDRFSFSSVEETGGSGRSRAISIIMTEFLPDHLFFGSGIGGANMLSFASQYHFPNLCHNIVFDPLSQLGVIIFSIFLYFLVSVFKKIYRFMKSHPSQSIFVALLIAILFNGIGETIFYEKYFWNDIALCILCCNMYDIKRI